MAIITNVSPFMFGSNNDDYIDARDALSLGYPFSTIYGGMGNDTYLANANLYVPLFHSGDVIIEAANGGIDTVIVEMYQEFLGGVNYGNKEYTLSANVENLSVAADTNATNQIFDINGNDLVNVISTIARDSTTHFDIDGGAGNDKITAGYSNDTLRGGLGVDTLIGGNGNDEYHVDSSADSIIELIGNGYDIVRSTATYTLSANLEGLSLIGNGNINGTGNQLNNYIYGHNGNNKLMGLDGSDQLYGAYGNDTLLGGNGDDTIYGEIGNDSLDGGDGQDFLFGGQGNDILLGGAGADDLNGGAGADKILGGTGDDTLYGADGIDTLDGGGGNDNYLIDATDIVTDTGVGGSDSVYAAAQLTGDLAAGIENLYMSNYASVGRGNALGNMIVAFGSLDSTLFGFAGNDSLLGYAGNDILDGGDGNDTLDGGADNDLMRGGNGNDVYLIDSIDDAAIEVSASGGTADTIFSSVNLAYGFVNQFIENINLMNGATIAYGNAQNNVMIGTSESDFLYGNLGKDTLIGGLGADTLIGAAGDDTFYVDHVTEDIREYNNEGIDIILASVSFTAANFVENLTMIEGAAAAIHLTGNAQNNVLTGNSLNNTFNGLAGADTLKGGLGDDNYTLQDSFDTIIELANQGYDRVYSTTSLTLVANLEELTLLGSATVGTGNILNNKISGAESVNYRFDGAAGDDELVSSTGSDTLIGGLGNDTLNGGTSADSMTGGAGNDFYYYDVAGDTVVELAGGGTDTVKYSGSGITLDMATIEFANIENIEYWGNANVNGNLLNNKITDLLGANNSLVGGAGNDTIDGGLGSDTMVGGIGNDVYYIDIFTDVVTELSNGGVDKIFSSASVYSSSTLNVEMVTLTESDDLRAVGNDAFADTLVGNDGNNQLLGLGGNDTLIGGNGNDILEGGLGVDKMVGGMGDDYYLVQETADIVIESVGGGTDIVTANTTYTLGANVEQLFLQSGSANINGTGNAGDNIIVGNLGNNIIIGGAGNDTLIAGGGLDTITGGTGNDVFVFDNIGLEKVTDYTLGQDTLALNISGLSFTGAGGTLQASQFQLNTTSSADLTGTQSSDSNNFIIYQQATGSLYYDADANGLASSMILIADLTNGTALNATDFFEF